MASTKRALIVATTLVICIIVAFTSLIDAPEVAGTAEEDGWVTVVLSPEEAENLFFAQDSDRISMYGDPGSWDDEKNLSIDLNGDGQSDINFSISSSKSEGIDLKGSVKQHDGNWKSMNFWSSDLYRLFRNSLKEKAQVRTVKAKDFLTLNPSGLISLLQEGKYILKDSCLTDNDFVQISVCDIDKDGSAEVLASVGNQLDGYVTAFYEISFSGGNPFIYCGQIICV